MDSQAIDAPRADLPEHIRAWARELGFADAAIARLDLEQDREHLDRWIADGRHGTMHYMARDPAMRTEPARLRPGTLSVISLRLDYLPQDAADAQATLDDGDRAYISRYALGRDYHKLLRSRLKKLAERIAAAAPHGYRVFADSAPILEKALARNANLGWIGKHTLLLNRQAGSWFFLGEIFTDLPLPADPRPVPRNHCGSCSACIEICPTRAITGPQQLDARRCISYLTIEHRGSIPLELRSAIGNRIFGCDDCQLVCPWNQYAKLSSDPAFAPRHGLDRARLVELSGWGEDEWLRKTEGMALRRAGYAGFLRNVAVALGNAPTSAAVVAALTRLTTADPIVREHADWALQRHSAAKAG